MCGTQKISNFMPLERSKALIASIKRVLAAIVHESI
jgi:hypothetical protein